MYIIPNKTLFHNTLEIWRESFRITRKYWRNVSSMLIIDTFIDIVTTITRLQSVNYLHLTKVIPQIKKEPSLHLICTSVIVFLGSCEEVVVLRSIHSSGALRRPTTCSEPVGIMDGGGVLFMSLRIWHLWAARSSDQGA